MISKDALDDIQSPFGSMLSRVRFNAPAATEQPEIDPAQAVQDAQYMARLEDTYADVAAPTPTFTWMYMAFPPCPQGRLWEVMRIGVSAQNATVLAGVTAHIYKGVLVPQNSNTFSNQLSDFIAFQGQVPNTTYPARLGVLLHPGERVIVAITGLLAAQTVAGSMGFIDRDMRQFLRSLTS